MRCTVIAKIKITLKMPSAGVVASVDELLSLPKRVKCQFSGYHKGGHAALLVICAIVAKSKTLAQG